MLLRVRLRRVRLCPRPVFAAAAAVFAAIAAAAAVVASAPGSPTASSVSAAVANDTVGAACGASAVGATRLRGLAIVGGVGAQLLPISGRDCVLLGVVSRVPPGVLFRLRLRRMRRRPRPDGTASPAAGLAADHLVCILCPGQQNGAEGSASRVGRRPDSRGCRVRRLGHVERNDRWQRL